jgi:hypothetical protein
MRYQPATLADRARLLRVAAAAILVISGWCFGFFSGRISAWIFPVDSRANRLVAEQQPVARQPARLEPTDAEQPVVTAEQESEPPHPEQEQPRPTSSASSDPAAKPAPQGPQVRSSNWTLRGRLGHRWATGSAFRGGSRDTSCLITSSYV